MDYYEYVGLKMSNKNKFDIVIEILAYDNKDKFYIIDYDISSQNDRIKSAKWVDVNEIINNYVQI